MRNHLDRLAQIAAFAFSRDHRAVDAARCVVAVLRAIDAGESFVVSEIQVGLCAVNSDIDFAMLIRRHCSGVYIDVGIKLLEAYPIPALLQKQRNGCRGQTFTKRRHNTARNKDMLSHLRSCRHTSPKETTLNGGMRDQAD